MVVSKWLGATGSIALCLVVGCSGVDPGADPGAESTSVDQAKLGVYAPTGRAAPANTPAAEAPAPAAAPAYGCSGIVIPQAPVMHIAPAQVTYHQLALPPITVPQMAVTERQVVPAPISVPIVTVTEGKMQPPAYSVRDLSVTTTQVQPPPIMVPEVSIPAPTLTQP